MKTQARITHNGVQLWPRTKQGRFTSLKSKIKFAFRWFIIRAGIATAATAVMFAAYLYGSLTTPNLTAVNQITIIAAKDIAPILHKICMAESGCQQFSKNGLPTFHANINGSVDLGKYQINDRAWGAKAKELGYDLLTEKGQDAMATWILENKGSGPWFNSSKGWEK